MRFPRRAWIALSALAVFVVAAVASRTIWMTWLGACLVEQQAPYKADIVVVLGGDLRGDRILRAAGLVCRGYAPRVLVSGSGPIYGVMESDLAVAFAVAHGYDRNLFLTLPYLSQSTAQEAQHVATELHRLHVQRFLLVTSNFHTHRAAVMFRREVPDLAFHVVASTDLYFQPNTWWKSREGQKTFLMEWSKTWANWLGD